MSDYLDHKSELNRKTLEALEQLAHKFETGRTHPILVAAKAGAIWDVTAGLVSNDISELAAQLHEAAKAAAAAKATT